LLAIDSVKFVMIHSPVTYRPSDVDIVPLGRWLEHYGLSSSLSSSSYQWYHTVYRTLNGRTVSKLEETSLS